MVLFRFVIFVNFCGFFSIFGLVFWPGTSWPLLAFGWCRLTSPIEAFLWRTWSEPGSCSDFGGPERSELDSDPLLALFEAFEEAYVLRSPATLWIHLWKLWVDMWYKCQYHLRLGANDGFALVGISVLGMPSFQKWVLVASDWSLQIVKPPFIALSGSIGVSLSKFRDALLHLELDLVAFWDWLSGFETANNPENFETTADLPSKSAPSSTSLEIASWRDFWKHLTSQPPSSSSREPSDDS